MPHPGSGRRGRCRVNGRGSLVRSRRRPPPISSRRLLMLPRALHRLLVVAIVVMGAMAVPRADDVPPFSVQITSPLGRIGAHTNMRVVAQVQNASSATLLPIRFYVDGKI